jgi:hypothetical protein
MPMEGVLSTLFRENALTLHFKPKTFSGSFDSAPATNAREKLSSRSAQDDSTRIVMRTT